MLKQLIIVRHLTKCSKGNSQIEGNAVSNATWKLYTKLKTTDKTNPKIYNKNVEDNRDDNDEDYEEMFVNTPFDNIEWGGPLRGGKNLEPTRFGDWERKGRCTDY